MNREKKSYWDCLVLGRWKKSDMNSRRKLDLGGKGKFFSGMHWHCPKSNHCNPSDLGFLAGSGVKNSTAMQKMQDMPRVRSQGCEDPLEEGMATHSSILALENPMDRGVWQATVHRATQSQKQLKRMSTIPHIHETNKNIHMIFSKVVKYLTKLNIMMEIFSKLLIEENIQSEK